MEPLELAKLKDPTGSALKAPLTTVAALGLAQASGFGVYLASTTSLGFVTHAVGITLPFAMYTGLSSTIAFLIGPAGWLGVSAWGSVEAHAAFVADDHARAQPQPQGDARTPVYDPPPATSGASHPPSSSNPATS